MATDSGSRREQKSLHDLSWRYAQDGKLAVEVSQRVIVDANPAFVKMTGYSRHELVGMHVIDLHPQEEHARILESFARGSIEAVIHTDLHLLRKDGTQIPVQIWASEVIGFHDGALNIVEFRDITNRLRYQHELSAKNWALSAFSGTSLALSQAHSEAELLQAICEAITTQSVYVFAMVTFADAGEEQPIGVKAASGPALESLRTYSMSESRDDWSGPTGRCLRTQQIQIVDDFEEETRFEPFHNLVKSAGVRSLVAVPLPISSGWRGALIVGSAEPGAFHSQSLQVFQRLGEQIVHGIGALRHKEQLEAERRNLEVVRRHLTEVLASTIAAMVMAMEARDPYTAGHESRVAEICVAIGREMGWDEERLLGMRLGAMVHDIGKIAIPAEILSRPGRLSSAEFELVKAHADTGYTILRDIPFTWPIALMVQQHHERLDGSAYPLGLKADRILLESKVLAVADMVEAIGADRPYRRARGLNFALKQIESEAGTLLDAEAVRVCAALFREKRLVVAGLNWS